MPGGSIARLFVKFVMVAMVMTATLRLVSGRHGWTRAWLYAGVVSGSQFLIAVYLVRVSPDLMVERARIREGTKTFDKILAPAVVVGPLVVWVVASLDVRSHWPPAVPAAWSAVAFVLLALSFWFIAWAMVANRFFSATVRIQTDRGHVVADGGPYRFVRHPGYLAIAVFTLASPLALGSWRALIPAVLTVAALLLRTALEDRTLRAELAGYRDYAARVPRRLLPGLW
jgi:protein-S-isoprenylcysteine O-methyltransferase Ste14